MFRTSHSIHFTPHLWGTSSSTSRGLFAPPGKLEKNSINLLQLVPFFCSSFCRDYFTLQTHNLELELKVPIYMHTYCMKVTASRRSKVVNVPCCPLLPPTSPSPSTGIAATTPPLENPWDRINSCNCERDWSECNSTCR